jgi:hypothetical protein
MPKPLMRKDIEHFADAIRARGLDPSSVRDRGLGGADGVVELAQWIEGRVLQSRHASRRCIRRPSGPGVNRT